MTDFSAAYHGSIIILTPQTDDAEVWVEDNLPADAQQWAGGTVIEHRYFDAIHDGITADGLTIS